MKILLQTDDECEFCKGKGIRVIPYSYSNKCEQCKGTGKKLEWQEIVIRGNSIYIL